MVKYTLIIEYLSKGNNFSQIATLCSCSRTTVWQVLQRIDFLNISLDEIKEMKEEELRFLLFPERIKKGMKRLVWEFTIDYKEAKSYRKEREGMLRQNQWHDLTVRVFM